MNGTELELKKVGECIDCQSDIVMDQAEIDWWAIMTAEGSERKLDFPKRCKPCRLTKRVSIQTKPPNKKPRIPLVLVKHLHTFLCEISEDAILPANLEHECLKLRIELRKLL